MRSLRPAMILQNCAALALVLAHSAPAQALELTTVVSEQSALTFVFHEMGVAVDGRFRRFAAQVDFDPARPALARAAIDLDLGSIDTGSDEANDEVIGKAWFDAKAYPRARFDSTTIRALGGDRYEVSGQLSIKGRTHAVVAPFTFTPQARGGAIDGAFTLKRADFTIGEGSWSDFGTVANEVEVKFHFLAGAAK